MDKIILHGLYLGGGPDIVGICTGMHEILFKLLTNPEKRKASMYNVDSIGWRQYCCI